MEVISGGIVAAAGIKAAGIKTDKIGVAIITNESGPATAVGAFTTNKVKAAPVEVTAKKIRKGKISAIVANSGCANAFTGELGLKNAHKIADILAKELNLNAEEIAVASTGIIGRQLPLDTIEEKIKILSKQLSSNPEASLNAAKAIMTTDKFPKEIAVKTALEDGTEIHIGGIAKGAGMIGPRLKTATILCFLTTDAAISRAALKRSLQEALGQSLNMAVVEGDLSTNDAVLLLANGRAKNQMIKVRSEKFQEALNYVTQEIAKMIIKNAEGATKFIEVQVLNARTKIDAKKIALAIVRSPLVKAAFFGEDPNWGRIAAAAGSVSAAMIPEKLSITYENSKGQIAKAVEKGKIIVNEGTPELLQARELLKDKELKVLVDLGIGKSKAIAWGCDLSYDYIKVNAVFTT